MIDYKVCYFRTLPEFWCSRSIGVDIFTQGRTLDELMENIREAVGLHYEESIDAGEQITIVSLTVSPIKTE